MGLMVDPQSSAAFFSTSLILGMSYWGIQHSATIAEIEKKIVKSIYTSRKKYIVWKSILFKKQFRENTTYMGRIMCK